jgi:DNA-binding NarL/FixJ family response regulator
MGTRTSARASVVPVPGGSFAVPALGTGAAALRREGRVLRALAIGHSVGAIAEGWFVSQATVRSQVRASLTKLGVSSQLEAVVAAHRHQWLRVSA